MRIILFIILFSAHTTIWGKEKPSQKLIDMATQTFQIIETITEASVKYLDMSIMCTLDEVCMHDALEEAIPQSKNPLEKIFFSRLKQGFKHYLTYYEKCNTPDNIELKENLTICLKVLRNSMAEKKELNIIARDMNTCVETKILPLAETGNLPAMFSIHDFYQMNVNGNPEEWAELIRKYDHTDEYEVTSECHKKAADFSLPKAFEDITP